jgi:hypothetical protein
MKVALAEYEKVVDLPPIDAAAIISAGRGEAVAEDTPLADPPPPTGRCTICGAALIGTRAQFCTRHSQWAA